MSKMTKFQNYIKVVLEELKKEEAATDKKDLENKIFFYEILLEIEDPKDFLEEALKEKILEESEYEAIFEHLEQPVDSPPKESLLPVPEPVMDSAADYTITTITETVLMEPTDEIDRILADLPTDISSVAEEEGRRKKTAKRRKMAEKYGLTFKGRPTQEEEEILEKIERLELEEAPAEIKNLLEKATAERIKAAAEWNIMNIIRKKEEEAVDIEGLKRVLGHLLKSSALKRQYKEGLEDFRKSVLAKIKQRLEKPSTGYLSSPSKSKPEEKLKGLMAEAFKKAEEKAAKQKRAPKNAAAFLDDLQAKFIEGELDLDDINVAFIEGNISKEDRSKLIALMS